jgi:hypothetical protein
VRNKTLRGVVLLLISAVNLVSIKPVYAAPLYSFSSFTFNNCGYVGINGPTDTACATTANYAAQSIWTSNVSYFSVVSGYQYWQVPATGTYTLIAAGARGGNGGMGGAVASGYGAKMQGTFTLTQGDIIKILIGQSGRTFAEGSGGGGGGTFVYNQTRSTLLLVAGGGGGAGHDVTGGHGVTGTSGGLGTPNGGGGGSTTGGSAGAALYGGAGGGGSNPTSSDGAVSGNGLPGGGGGGFGGNGGSAQQNNQSSKGLSFLNGGTGGYHNYSAYGSTTSASGGFGGGGTGGGYSGYQSGGGGGGGYAGGGGGDGLNAGGGGGGGGSYNAGTLQSNVGGENIGPGYLTVTYTQPTLTTITVSMDNGKNYAYFRTTTGSRIKSVSDTDGYVKFSAKGKVIAGCQKVPTASGVAYCNWKPSTHSAVTLTASITPTSGSYLSNTSSPITVSILSRVGNR